MKIKVYFSKKSIIPLILFCLFATACKNKSSKDISNDISFTSIQVEKTYHLLENPDNPNCNLVINFTYPDKLGNKDLLQTVQQLFISSYMGENYTHLTPKEAVNLYVEDYIEMYKELEEDLKNDLKKAEETGSPIGSWYSYYEMSGNEITYNENNLLSYTVNFENYTGGAHGAHSYTNHVINLQTGKFITEKDIFIENFQDLLAQILVDKIAKQNNVADAKELENIGFFSVDEIYPNGNFLIDAEGITYSFNEYEIAAYVVGLTNVYLPYKEIKYLLLRESPIADLIYK